MRDKQDWESGYFSESEKIKWHGIKAHADAHQHLAYQKNLHKTVLLMWQWDRPIKMYNVVLLKYIFTLPM